MDAHEQQNFREFVANRSPELLNAAILLSGGDQHAAEDLLRNALVKTARRWQRINEPEAYVREMLCRQQTRRRESSERSADGDSISAAELRIHGAPSAGPARPEADVEQRVRGALKANAPEVRLSDGFSEQVYRS